MTRIRQECWIDGCNHGYECDDLEHLVRAVAMHLEADHRGIETELFVV